MLTDEEQDGESSRKVEVGRSTRETVNTYIDRFYYQITDCSRKRCNPSGLQQTIKDDIFCSDYKRDVSRRVSKTLQR